LKPDAQYALLLESIAEINARLRILDDANARLEAAVERQLELLELLITSQQQPAQHTPAGSRSPLEAA
jgi:hypothetical protein